MTANKNVITADEIAECLGVSKYGVQSAEEGE